MAAAAGCVVAAVVVPAAALTGTGKPKPVRVTTSAYCPAAAVPVEVRVEARAQLTKVPRGWTLVSGSPDQPQAGITYASPADEAQARSMGRYTTYTPPSVRLAVTLPSTTPANPSPTVPAASHPAGPPPDPFPGAETATATVNGFSAKVITTYNGPAGQAPSPAYPQTQIITWSPAPDTTIGVTGTNIPGPELLDIARSATYQPGTVQQLPATPSFTVSASKAERVLGPAARSARAALSSWAEVRAVAARGQQTAPDYRPVWLVYAPSTPGRVTWAVVDARTDQILQPPTTSTAGWVHMVTDRSQPGCQPPLGVTTRSEMTQIEFGGPAPAGYRLLLTGGSQAEAVMGQPANSSGPLATAPLVWITYRLGAQIDVRIANALTAQLGADMSGPGPLRVPLPDDLDPGPTPTQTTPVTPSVGHATGPAPARPVSPPPGPGTSTPTSEPIVGPSPFYPGTTKPKPAPAGNGKGPAGSCSGTETYPPCGPGAVADQYYPYTLPANCTGYLYFDGRWWQQTLYEPSQHPQNVWMAMAKGRDDTAGWVGPGAVGLRPAPPGPPPPCGTTPASVPALSSSG